MKKIFQITILIIISSSQILSSQINDYFINLTTDFLEQIDKTAYNINTKTIQYSLTYEKSILKVLIKTVEKIQKKVKFIAFLLSDNSKNEHQLKCSYPHEDIIECKTKPGLKLNINDTYHIYYNRSKNEKLIFDYENIMEDDKKISLIFKPDLYVNQTVYLDNKKIMAQINRKCVAGGYLYVIKKSKGVQNIPKDGFNKYFELNNFIYQPDYNTQNIIESYKEAIRRGYHMIEAEVVLVNDNIPVIYNGKKNNNDYNNNFVKFNEILKLCKTNEIIIDIKFNYLNSTSQNKDIKSLLHIIMEEIKKSEMLTDIILEIDFTDLEKISQLKNIIKDATLSISLISKKEEIEKARLYLNNFKRIIFTIGPDINESTLNYIKKLGYKIKFSNTIDTQEFSDYLVAYGVNYINTKNLEPFLIHNNKDFPMRVECVPIFMDDLSECKLSEKHILRDNELYNIHYSTNIYNKSMDINETAIGDFRYEDTKINDMRYYVIKNINFEKGIIILITSDKITERKIVKGKIGPNYDNVAECYIFDFTCKGLGQNYINCEIEKTKDKVEYKGEYVIYKFDNYSYNEEEIEDFNLMKLKNKRIYSKTEKIIYTFFITIISFALFYYLFSCLNNNSEISNIYD